MRASSPTALRLCHSSCLPSCRSSCRCAASAVAERSPPKTWACLIWQPWTPPVQLQKPPAMRSRRRPRLLLWLLRWRLRMRLRLGMQVATQQAMKRRNSLSPRHHRLRVLALLQLLLRRLHRLPAHHQPCLRQLQMMTRRWTPSRCCPWCLLVTRRAIYAASCATTLCAPAACTGSAKTASWRACLRACPRPSAPSARALSPCPASSTRRPSPLLPPLHRRTMMTGLLAPPPLLVQAPLRRQRQRLRRLRQRQKL